jgi:hypothetical protein
LEAECRYCVHLTQYGDPPSWMLDVNGMPTWRCPFGRFDQPAPDNKPIKRWFAWSGIWAPDKAVAEAQKDCQRFEVHPQAKTFTEKARVL